MSKLPVVIVGSGLAGYTVAREFRKLDTETPLLMISVDHAGFYSKPMLSNAFAQKKTAEVLLMKNAEQMATDIQADIRVHTKVTSIDPLHKTLTVDGEAIHFSKLVLALGADPICIPITGNGATGILSVNNLEDYQRFRSAVEGKRDLVILGAGLIGCEFANDCVAAGLKVHVIDMAPQVLGRLLPAESATFMQHRLETAGITFHLGTSIQQADLQGERYVLSLANGETVEADVVLSAVGLKPRTDLALSAGIAINRGIVVNNSLQTSVEDIFALGDCAEIDGQVLPFIMPIMHAARALGSTLAGNLTQVSFPPMPVTVKTPACAAVILPPKPGLNGFWLLDSQPGGIKAVFQNTAAQVLGFALLGEAVAEKNSITQLVTDNN